MPIVKGTIGDTDRFSICIPYSLRGGKVLEGFSGEGYTGSSMVKQFIETIERLSEKGDGVCYAPGGRLCHVAGALPGEQVNVEIVRRKRKAFVGGLRELLTESEERVAPRCVHAGKCGGCRLQHLSQKAQLAFKQEKLNALFAPYPVNPIVACVDPWRYRNKMEFTFSQDRAGERFLGLIEGGSKGRVLNLGECHICPPKMTEVLQGVKAWWNGTDLPAFVPHKGEGVMRLLTVRYSERTGSCHVVLTVSQQLPEGNQAALIRALEPMGTSLYVTIQRAIKGQPTEFIRTALCHDHSFCEEMRVHYGGKDHTYQLSVAPEAFLQPNTAQAERIVECILAMIAPTGNETILDLYSGVGTLGMGLSPFVSEVIAIEVVEEAARNAVENAAANGLNNITSFGGSVEAALADQELRGRMNEVDVVVVDPPRNGLGEEVAREIVGIGADRLVYVSCNPKTQREDLRILEEAYEVVTLQPIDQFPHTMHVENLALLKKRQSAILAL